MRCIRPRPGIADAQLPFEVARVPWSPRGRFLVSRDIRPGSFLNFAAGDYAVQDAASLLPLTLMQLRAGDHVIDCCAAPGGKSAAILEQLAGTGVLVSNEVIASRIETLQLTLGRTGMSNYMLTHEPVERLTAVMAEQFDCVLVDAPCTGQSLVARDKQSMSAFSEHQIAHSAARQQTILQSAIGLVRPGGRLVYSTCTFAYQENEAIIAWLREQLPGWQPVILPELAPWQTPGFDGCYRLWPHRDQCAGGFAAALIRPEDDLSTIALASATTSGRRQSKHHSRWQSIDFRSQIDQWCELSEVQPDGTVESNIELYQHQQSVCWFSPLIPDAWRQLAWSGIELATSFGDHWQPAWPLAVLTNHAPTATPPSTDRTASAAPIAQALHFLPHQAIALDSQQAQTYFTGTSIHSVPPSSAQLNTITSKASSTSHPWQLVTWQSRPLGWTKHTNHQLKNHLPKPLRHPTLTLPPESPPTPT